MIGKLLATTALLLVVSSGAQAQTAAAVMASGYQMTPTDALASKVIGSAVYSTIATNGNAASNASNAAPASGSTATNSAGAPAGTATDTNAQQIGTIRDLVVSSDGKIQAAVVGIGGVLGLGEKSVAVDYSQLHWAVAQDGSIRGTLDTTVDALKAAPDFQWPAGGQATNAGQNGNAAATNGNMAAAPAANNAATAPAANMAANNNANAPAPEVDPSTLKPTSPTAIKADDLKGADVIDPNGVKIASVNDFVLTQDGKIDAAIVDFGGFLGIGTKQIALAADGLKFMDDANGKHYLVVNVTKDQLNAARAYNKDDYAANRDAERLEIKP